MTREEILLRTTNSTWIKNNPEFCERILEAMKEYAQQEVENCIEAIIKVLPSTLDTSIYTNVRKAYKVE